MKMLKAGGWIRSSGLPGLEGNGRGLILGSSKVVDMIVYRMLMSTKRSTNQGAKEPGGGCLTRSATLSSLKLFFEVDAPDSLGSPFSLPAPNSKLVAALASLATDQPQTGRGSTQEKTCPPALRALPGGALVRWSGCA